MITSTHKKRHLYQQIAIAFVFSYMIASIIWWYIALQSQSIELSEYQWREQRTPHLLQHHLSAQEQLSKSHLKFLSEGITFLGFIILGWMALAWMVFKQYKINEQQHYFLELLAHETKTPITITKIHLQNLQRQGTSPKNASSQQTAVSASLAQMDYLDMIVNKFLILLRLENSAYTRPALESVEVETILRQCIKKIQMLFPHGSYPILIQQTSPTTLSMMGDPVLLEVLFSNLIENTFKHSQSEKGLEITLAEEASSVVLCFRDFGVGIPKPVLQQLFKKHHPRSATSRSGVGLRIAHLVCQYHSGSICYQSMEQGGTFIITFPKL